MTRFYPIYVRRSDGKLDVPGKNGRLRDRNAPSTEQLDSTPNKKGIADFYREIGVDETKHIDWRRKLAGMLVKQIGKDKYQERQMTSILVTLPENYRLYEHIKSRTTDKDGDVPKKNHAGGGHDRQDAYLYGHPMGPKKRFRSPADFFPHLLWLCTDPNGNTDNCSCKLCCPEEIEEKKTTQAAQSPVKKEEPEIKQEGKESQPSRPSSRGPTTELTNRSTTNPSPLARRQSPVPRLATPSALPTATPAGPVSSQLPVPRSIDQQVDTSSNKFHNRPGEIVWFDRGQAWGLGVITRRYRTKNERQQEVRNYIIQPLSYPLHNPPLTTLTEEKRLRPWLAWSPPPLTHQSLQNAPDPTRMLPYHTIDWTGVVEGKYGMGDVEVDASILAAKSVEDTFTLTEPLKRTIAPGGGTEIHWNSIYLGGEKIWLGDPLRLRIGSGREIMALTEIVEHETTSPPQSTYMLFGDLYSLVTFESTSHEPPDNRNIPIRMREDLKWRNGVTTAAKRGQSYWKLMQGNVRLGITDIKGRWYEDSYLLPLLSQDPNQLQQDLARGLVQEQNSFLNARADATNRSQSKDPGVRCNSRNDAFGKSIPATTMFASGIDPPPQSQQQRALQQQQEGIEQFVNMDVDEVPGFGQRYSSQGQEQSFF